MGSRWKSKQANKQKKKENYRENNKLKQQHTKIYTKTKKNQMDEDVPGEHILFSRFVEKKD